MSKRSRRRKGKRGAATNAPRPSSPAGDDFGEGEDDDDAIEYVGPNASTEWRGTGGHRALTDDATPPTDEELASDRAADTREPGRAGDTRESMSESKQQAKRSGDAPQARRGGDTRESTRGGDARDAKREAKRESKRGGDARDAKRDKGAKAPARPRGFGEAWNAFFFAPRDPRLASVLRIGFAVLVLVNLAVLAPDLRLWFSEDGLVPAATAEQIINEHALTLFSYLPHADWVLYGAFGVFVAQTVLLLVGWHTRVQAIGVFIWLVTFQHRNYAIVDGEDTVLRMFAFYLALCPAGWAFSLDALRRKPEAPPPAPWALRLFQIQISIIYLSSAIEKSLGTHWTGGRALYYIARLDDAFGKWPMPTFPFESWAMIKIMTWSVFALEWALPVLLWVKRTRKVALVVAIVFHLAIDYTMNLFLFHWIMILGLLAFAEYDELARLRFWRR